MSVSPVLSVCFAKQWFVPRHAAIFPRVFKAKTRPTASVRKTVFTDRYPTAHNATKMFVEDRNAVVSLGTQRLLPTAARVTMVSGILAALRFQETGAVCPVRATPWRNV